MFIKWAMPRLLHPHFAALLHGRIDSAPKELQNMWDFRVHPKGTLRLQRIHVNMRPSHLQVDSVRLAKNFQQEVVEASSIITSQRLQGQISSHETLSNWVSNPWSCSQVSPCAPWKAPYRGESGSTYMLDASALWRLTRSSKLQLPSSDPDMRYIYAIQCVIVVKIYIYVYIKRIHVQSPYYLLQYTAYIDSRTLTKLFYIDKDMYIYYINLSWIYVLHICEYIYIHKSWNIKRACVTCLCVCP